MAPEVDLVITFQVSNKHSLSKQQTREEAQRAEQQYSRLLETLSYAGLQAVGRRGESLGHLLVFVKCPDNLLQTLVKRERQSDFLSGLPKTPVKSDASVHHPAPADRLRLVHAYVTSIPSDGGLGVTPGSPEWDLVDSVMCLHDHEFNEQWIHAWTHKRTVSVSAARIRDQFGDSVSLYFTYLDSYTRALVFPACLGVGFYFFSAPYSPLYSTLLLIWAVIYIEWWRVHERLFSLRFGTRGSFKVEKRRAQYTPGFAWWHREIRMLASLPVILLFAGILFALLTAIFVFEAFVTQLYTGPGHRFLTFTPTILFALLVPRLLAIYQASIQRFTAWENHAHHSSHAASLTIKTFALSSLVAYLGLALSAFVYVPFGEGIMRVVQVWLFNGPLQNITFLHPTFLVSHQDHKVGGEKKPLQLWDADLDNASTRLNTGRLRDQMFAYTVTNQIINTFLEIGLPYVLRFIQNRRSKKGGLSTTTNTGGNAKKKVVFEDEKEKGGVKEKEFLETVRKEAALPEYDLFADYNEMVTQFGYVVLWSTIWPLAPVMALINNFFELRSDAFKITVHNRRPIPVRTDTIGPWLDALTFLAWLGTLTNSALVYLFCPRSHRQCSAGNTTLEKVHQHLFEAAGSATPSSLAGGETLPAGGAAGQAATKELLFTAILIALAASHGFIIFRTLVRHIIEKVVWKGSEEVKEREREDLRIKEEFLRGILGEESLSTSLVIQRNKDVGGDAGKQGGQDGDIAHFWDHDEGVDEIRRISKEA